MSNKELINEAYEKAKIYLERAQKAEHQNARLLSLLRELYAAANPSILDDADTGVRLPPEWKERILGEI